MNRTVTTLAVVLLVATAGCVGSIPGLGDGGDGSTADPVEHVPAGVDVVVTVDAAVAEDENTRQVLNTLFEESEAGPGEPQNVDEAFDEFQDEVNANLTRNLSLDEINGAAAFARTPEDPQEAGEIEETEQYAGVVLSVDWNREDVLTNLREEATVTEEEYSGVTVYQIENESAETPLYGAEYESGLWAFSGNRTVVEDVIDVSQGEADTFGGDLRTAFDQTRDDAYVRYAAVVSDQQRETLRQFAQFYSAQAPVDLTQFGDVTAYSGAYYTTGDQIGVSTYLTATNESSAERLNQTIGALITLGKGTVEPDSPTEAQLNALSTEQDGETLAITYEIAVETLQELIREEASAAPAPALAPSSEPGVDRTLVTHAPQPDAGPLGGG